MGPTRMNRSMPLKFGTCSRIDQQIIKKLKLFGKYMKTSNRRFLLIIQRTPQICYHFKRIRQVKTRRPEIKWSPFSEGSCLCRPSHRWNSLYITLLSNTQMIAKNQFTLNQSNSSFRSQSLPCVFVSDSAAISRLQSHQLLTPIISLPESRSLLHISTIAIRCN